MPSIDLMVHISYSHLNGLSFRDIEKYLAIAKSTAHRWYTTCYEYIINIKDPDQVKSIINEQKEKDKENKQIVDTNTDILKFISKSLSIQPFQTILVLQEKIEKQLDIHLAMSTVSKYVKTSKFSRKKITKRLYNVKNFF